MLSAAVLAHWNRLVFARGEFHGKKISDHICRQLLKYLLPLLGCFRGCNLPAYVHFDCCTYSALYVFARYLCVFFHMALPNIQRFNEYTGAILASLYENFPMRKALVAEDFIEGGADAVMVPDDFLGERPSDEAEFFMATARWLVDAGYILTNDAAFSYIGNATLTPKALEALNAVPDSLSGKASIGERMVGAVKAGATQVLRTTAQEAIAAGIKALIA